MAQFIKHQTLGLIIVCSSILCAKIASFIFKNGSFNLPPFFLTLHPCVQMGTTFNVKFLAKY